MKGIRRRDGVCWCCASPRKVRRMKLWLDGSVVLLCKECEPQVAHCTPPIPWEAAS